MKNMVTREELYELVWSKPITQLSKEYGFSDRGFAKVCERFGVPVPPRGYWAKQQAGKSVRRPPLMVFGGSAGEKIHLENEGWKPAPVSDTKPEPPPEMPDVLRQAIEREKTSPENEIKVPHKLPQPHKLVARLLVAEEKEKKFWSSLGSSSRYKPKYDSPEQKRFLIIWDTLLKAYKERGFRVDRDYEDGDKAALYLDSHHLILDVVAEKELVTRPMTREERRQQPWQNKDALTSEWQETGVLSVHLQAREKHAFSRTWTDTPDKKLEDVLNEIIIATYEGIWEVTKSWKAQQQRWEEQSREEEKRRRKEQKIQRRAEARKAIHQAALKWQEAKNIRSFVEHVLQATKGTEHKIDDKVLDRWRETALSIADELDPLIQGLSFTPEPEDDEPEEATRQTHEDDNWFRMRATWPRKKY